MQEMVPLEIVIPLGVLGALLAFVVGRVTATSSRRLRELQSTLDDALREREQARQEAAAATQALDDERNQLEASRKESDAYRERVTNHFTETSHRLHELTLQYRAVYDHLADGASQLCSEGFQKLEGGLGLDALTAEGGPRREPVDDDSEASTAEARGGVDSSSELPGLDAEDDDLDAGEQVRVRGG